MIAIDADQDLYGRFSLKEMGIDFRGRTHMLPASYRCTQQIFEFAHRHYIRAEKIPPAEIGILYLSKRRIPEPAKVAAIPSGKRILQSFEQLRGVATPVMGETLLPDRIVSSLKDAGIPVNWFTENSAAKQSFDLHEPTVKVGTIHSAKGLDFEVVYLIDATGNPVGPPSKSVPADDATRKRRNLHFVGCTRARERLVILSHHGSGNH